MGFVKSAVILIKSRSKEIFMWMWFNAVACLIAGKGFPSLIPLLMSLITIFFISTSVYIYNDVIDSNLDKKNIFKNHRPIPRGIVTINDAKKLIFVSGFIGLLISFFLNIYSFIFSFIYFSLFFVYSFPRIYLKRLIVIKELILTSGHFFMSLIGCYAILGYFSINVFFASLINAILTFTFIPAFNDTTDIEADTLFGLKSLASVLSWKNRIQLVFIGLLIIMTLTPFTYVQFGFNMMLPIFIVLGGIIFLRFMYPIMNNFNQVGVLKARKIGYFFFLLLQIFAIIGSLNFKFIF